MKKRKFSRGFTLLEMLIVVAVIAVLVAIAIPTFGGSIKKAKAAACMANCRSMKAELTLAYMTDDADVPAIFGTVSEKYECPSGGTYALAFDGTEPVSIEVTCTVHGAGSESGGAQKVMTQEKLNSVLNAYSSLVRTNYLDSTAPDQVNGVESKRKQLQEALKKDGLSLDELGATSWLFDNSSGKYFMHWTPVDISSLPIGTKVPVMTYSSESGSFSVSEMTVSTSSAASRGSNKKYNVLTGRTAIAGFEYSSGQNVTNDIGKIQKTYREKIEALPAYKDLKY